MFLNYVLKVTIYDPNNSKLLFNSLIRGAFPKKCVTAYNPLTGE